MMNLRKLAALLLDLKPKFDPWLGRASIVLVAVVCLLSCSGGGSEPARVPAAIANLCPTAFTIDSSLARPAAASLPQPFATPAVQGVALSTCERDANNGVTIGSGGCGPEVY